MLNYDEIYFYAFSLCDLYNYKLCNLHQLFFWSSATLRYVDFNFNLNHAGWRILGVKAILLQVAEIQKHWRQVWNLYYAIESMVSLPFPKPNIQNWKLIFNCRAKLRVVRVLEQFNLWDTLPKNPLSNYLLSLLCNIY